MDILINLPPPPPPHIAHPHYMHTLTHPCPHNYTPLPHTVHHSQRRHLLAAHRIIHQQTETVVRELEGEEERKGDAGEPHTEQN